MASDYLATKLGGTWGVDSNLDDLFPTDPSPEAIVTNGRATAAIEVKRLTGDAIYQAYVESLLSNQRFLTPSCGGYYSLNPPVDLRLPMEVSLRSRVKKEIERVAPGLDIGMSGVIRLARQGHISLTRKSGPPTGGAEPTPWVCRAMPVLTHRHSPRTSRRLRMPPLPREERHRAA